MAKNTFSTLNQWLAWLEQAHPIQNIELGHKRILVVAEQLGLLKPKAPVITVAGTNGKGSVVASLEALAKSHHLKIGSYTSPHLIDFNERIKLNGEPVSDELIIQAFEVVSEAQEAQQATALTYFEFTTLVGLWIFAQQPLDLIALEVGLGGRLDAVNIIDADVAVITSIGLDHIAWLGDTLEKIAHEKAGIMRRNKPVIVADPNIEQLLQADFETIQPKTIIAQSDYQFSNSKEDDGWSLAFAGQSFEKLPNTDLFINNLAAAIMAFQQLFTDKIELSKIQQAFENIEFIGRFQKLSHKPLIIVDVAHNPDSARLLYDKLASLKSQGIKTISAICGMLKDKDIAASLQFMDVVDCWYCIDLPEPRGATGEQLRAHLESHFASKEDQSAKKSVKSYAQLVAAWDDYWQHHKPNEALVIFGSFVTVGQMLQLWNDGEKLKLLGQ